MNKYQKALNKIIRSCCPYCCDDNGCQKCEIKQTCNATAKSWVDTLQELVDKETPKGVINTGTEIFCPRCSKMFNFVIGGNGLCVTIPQYCSECGQKLGSDTDE